LTAESWGHRRNMSPLFSTKPVVKPVCTSSRSRGSSQHTYFICYELPFSPHRNLEDYIKVFVKSTF
jgi:hypothetical protein